MKRTLYLRKDGTYTANKNDPGIVYAPIYDKGTKNDALSQTKYTQVYNESVSYLKQNLSRYGYSDAQIEGMAAQILEPLAPSSTSGVPVATKNTAATPGTLGTFNPVG